MKSYIISGKVYNYKINNQDGKYFITTKNKFNNLVELVEYYKKNPAGLICSLKHPAKKGLLDVKPTITSEKSKLCLENIDTIYSKFIDF
jgi:hypothetical protein